MRYTGIHICLWALILFLLSTASFYIDFWTLDFYDSHRRNCAWIDTIKLIIRSSPFPGIPERFNMQTEYAFRKDQLLNHVVNIGFVFQNKGVTNFLINKHFNFMKWFPVTTPTEGCM
jgi:hypothetical protein